ncbi:response regulator transcription factor [Parachryseolinea silvisoli]|uniref:response regulator transcription factor n=1 Tax=Parachryseolinea silvisoli TaxID=2873601 RepID=UPI002265A2FA|nr:response regulator transcription factor [Parachryseolinea silvisoli]MCD9016184.1 response regulator transcription factor [Parachryseolinea silvisoli]
MISVSIVEDDEQIRKGVQTFLNRQPGFSSEYTYGSIEELLKGIQQGSIPNVIIMDLGLPGMSGIEGIKLVKEKNPDIDIIVFSVYNDPKRIFDSLCAGATGYLLKNTPLEEIKEGIELLAHGGSPMSPQIARKVIEHFGQPEKKKEVASPLSAKEKEIVVGLVDGLSYKLIADRMDISIETVRFHIKNIYRKLHVHGKAEVISKSLRGEI